MKFCSLCKSKYDDRVDFCFRDGTPLVPLDEEEPGVDAPEPAEDIYSSATRPFELNQEPPAVEPGPEAKAIEPADLPDRFTSGEGLVDVPEPGFGFLDAPDRAPLERAPDAHSALDVPAESPLDAPSSQLDAPESATLDPAADAPEAPVLAHQEDLEPARPLGMNDPGEPALSHGETMVPDASDDPPTPDGAEALPAPTLSEGFGVAEGFRDDFSAADAPEDLEEESDSDLAAVFEVPDDDPEEEEEGSSNRGIFVAMAIGGVLLLALLGWVLFGLEGKPGDDPVEPPQPPPHQTTAQHQPTPAPPPPPPPLPDPPVDVPEDPGAEPGEPGDMQDVAAVLEMDPPPEPPPPDPAPPPTNPTPRQPPREDPGSGSTTASSGSSGSTTSTGSASSGDPASTADPGATGDGGGRDIWGPTGQQQEPATTGALTIRSNPMGAVVKVEDDVVGRTPLVGKSLPVGSHMVRLELDGYRTVSKVANIRASQAEDLGTVQLESETPVSGTVTLWADVLIGSKIYIDNQYVGELPVKVELTEGKHTFFVQPAEGEAFTIVRDVHFDVQGIGISLELKRP